MTALEAVWRLALLCGAVLLATGGYLSLAFAECDGSYGVFCGGDLDKLTEGYGAALVLFAGAAALAARACSRRWTVVIAAALLAMVVVIVVALGMEDIF